jgi:subtilisin family serine protease
MRRALLSGALAVTGLAAVAAPAHAAGDPLRAQQWNLDLIESDAAHGTSTGAGAVVAVVDSGVQADHPDLAGRLAPGADLVDGDGTPQDGNGHGTHVAGIIGAATGNGVGIASVAPGATILPIRVLGDDGSGSTDQVAAGIDRARALGADVINLSLGSEVPLVGAMGGDAIDAAIRRALQAGIVVVAAAGNNGVPVCEQPAAADGLICVGAIDRRRQRSFFSSFGSGLAVVAPGGSALPAAGEDILSTYPPSGYQELAGTSQAAPHVSGVAALLVALGLHGTAVGQRILDTATDLGPAGPDAQYGHGLVNARAAVAGLPATPGPSTAAGGTPGVTPMVKLLGRRGRVVRVRLRAVATGRARVRLVAHRRTLALSRPQLQAGRARTVRLRMRHAVRGRGTVRVRLPGESRTRTRRLRLG